MATQAELDQQAFLKKQKALADIQAQKVATGQGITSSSAQQSVGAYVNNQAPKAPQATVPTKTDERGNPLGTRYDLSGNIVKQNATGGYDPVNPVTPTATTQNDLVSIRNGEVYIGGSIDPNMTPDQKQKYITQYGTEQDKINYSAGQIGGDPMKIIQTGDANKEAMTRLEQSVQSTKEQAKIKAAQEEATRRQNQEAIARTQSATETRFLTGREGVQANEGLGAGIALGVTRQLDDITRQAESFRLAADESAKQLEYYQKTKQTELAKAEAERLTELQTKASEAEAKRVAADTAAKTSAANIAKQQADATVSAFNSLDSFSPSMLGQMSATDVQTYIQNAGGKIDPITAAGISSTYKKIAELAQSKNADDQAQAALQRQQLMVNIQNSQKTEADKAVQNYTELKTALDKGQITQEYFDLKTGAETPAQKSEREYKDALAKAALAKVSPNSQGNTFNLSNIATGEALALGTLGNPQTMLRADRHNNPTAAKAYPTAISQLEAAGLKKGVDFNLGETTQGIDTDGVPTIVYSSPDAGVRGSIALLKAGQIASWYGGNPNYGGRDIVNAKISQLSGKPVNESNSQQVFNTLNAEKQVDVLKTIYNHEAGSRGNFLFDSTQSIAVEDPEFVSTLKSSAGGKNIDATARGRLDKTFSVLDQLESLQNILNKIPDTYKGPVAGRLASANPYYSDAQQVESALRAITPNLARGVYNEVGVLTDTDIENYIKTIPNLKQTPSTQQEILLQTLDVVNNSIKEQLDNAARSGVDVSQFVTKYGDTIKKVKALQSNVQNSKEIASSDAELLKSGGILQSVEDIWDTLPVRNLPVNQ